MAKRDIPNLTALPASDMEDEPPTTEHPTFQVHLTDMLGHLLGLYFDTQDPSILITMSHVLEQAKLQEVEEQLEGMDS